MDKSSQQSLRGNVSLLKQKASNHSIFGVIIGLVAIVVATMVSGYLHLGEVSIDAFLMAQKTNVVLWFLDAMPFVFAIWGQYVTTMISHEAGAMVYDQTTELRKRSEVLEQKAAHEATHDSLTGLPNRTLFMDRLQQATITAKRDDYKLAVVLLDLDHFKEVNDALGHYYGDRLLKQIGLRLSNVIRESDTLARIGGDEFAFVLPQLQKNSDVDKVIQKITKAFTGSFKLNKLSLEVRASLGVTLYPEHGKDADTLVQRADVAMYVAKQKKTGFSIYSKEFDEHSPQRLTLMGELRQAIRNDELILHYQPKILSETEQLYGVEALVRWNHSQHGLMPPNEFIPLAERTGLIDDLTLWVLKKALHQGAVWHNSGMNISVAVNVSAICLLNPDFPDVLTGLLTSHEYPAEHLVMEITETSIMADPERALAVIHYIHELGVKISIDDFGTGYSSLAYLKKLPVSELKIDKSFVMDMLSNESDSTIVKATIQLGHNLGLKVVAEGVESQEIVQELQSMGCDLLQGFFISRPVPADNLTSWALERSRISV